MKITLFKTFAVLAIVLVAAVGNAQSDSDPGRDQTTNYIAATQDGGGLQPQFQPNFTPITQTSSAIAEEITPDIQALADNLGGDPTRIFNYVHDQIRYVHYFGSKKGAELTLLEHSGNDFDQCALLSSLLQAAGYSPTYQFAMLKVPYDNPTNHQDLHHWLGLDFYNTNWSNTQTYFSYFTGTRGNPVWYTFPPDTNTIALQRVWVALTIGGTNYYLDPAFKISEPVTGANLISATGLNNSTLWTAAGGTDTGTSVSGLNEASLRGALQACNSNLLGYISNNIPDASVAQVIGGQQIVSSSGLPLRTNLAFSIYTNSTYLLLNWTNQPTNFMGTFSISLGGTNTNWFTPQLQGQRVSLTFDSNALAQLWLDDSLVLQTTNTGTSNTVNVILSATHPYGGGWSGSQYPIDGGVSKGFDRSSTNAYQRTNASYAIMYGFEASPQWLQNRQQKLDAYLQQGLANSSRQVTTETLNVMGLGWMVQTELAHELLCQEWNQLPENQHRFGRMGQEAGRGYYVDVYLQLDGTLPSTGYNSPDILANNEEFDVSSYFWSAMEHGIIEQLQNSNLVAASTIKMIEIANTNSQAVYMASSANWTAGANVRGSLANYGSTLSTLDNLIANNYILLLPQNGSNHVAGTGTWAGDGYVQLGTTANGRSMGMIIGGGYNGGFDSLPSATASGFAPFVSQSGDSQPTFFNPQTPTLQFAGQTGADPVNLVDGSFEITSSDLTLGQQEPRGLNLTRYYSSDRRNSNPAGMAPGWLHSYYCNVLPTSAPQLGLGGGTAQQMAPMIVATYAALNLYTNSGTLDPKNWTVTALIAKWGIDQLINNAVSVNLGKDTLQFLKQPDGSYTPPANCTMSLIPTNGTYWLQERHGRTFKFGSNNVLTNLVDQYGQLMTLAYNSNNLVTNVTDSKGRSLAFNYTGSNLMSVSDGIRSVSYGYTSGDLTSFTDVTGNTNGYIYDTNNELLATFDALGRLVVTNAYDGFGHVTTQLTQGATNKAWQIYASGYYTVEIDPAGGQQVFTYDGQSRLIASQDALGNVTQMVYDGQDHVIQTISPLNETNQFIYDSSNNLIETIDPLGFSNTFVFDSQNNLITATDARGNASHFGYNSQFSLTSSTNGAGNGFVLAYSTNGTLATRQDPGGTTSYGYDSYGQLNSITNPGSLGVESFVNNALGDPTSHTNPRGFVTTYGYNQRRQLTNTVAPTNLTASLGYDAVGNLQSSKDAQGNSTTYTWSATRHQTGTVFPSTPQGNPVVTNFYDVRDWLTQTLNPLQEASYYSRNPAQELISMADALLRTNTFVYDPDGHLTNSTDAASETTSQKFDARGETMAVTDPATKIVRKAYDPAGNLIYLTNRNSHVWQFQYDAANRLITTSSPLGNTTAQSYNNRGLLQYVTNPLNQITSNFYDARGRLTNRTDIVAVTAYVYDVNNNLTANSESGQSLASQYDAYDRVTSFTNAAGNVINYHYDNNGNLTSLVYPGGLAINYSYDALNRLTNVTDWSGRQTTNTYDLAGELTRIARPNGTLRTNGYDAAGQMTNIVECYSTGAMAIEYIAQSFNNAARMQWEFVAPLPHPFTPPSRTMTYDNDNRLATFNGTSVTIDADGNMTYGPGTNNSFITYSYDARNRLTGVSGVTYGYDPAGNRTIMTNGSVVTTNVLDPRTSQLLIRIRAGVTNYYIYGAGLLYEIDATATATTILYYHYDSRGSTVALTDGNGNITDRMEYSAYGTMTYRAGTNDTPFLYNGRYGVQTDPNGLLYMRARYYNPYICRFLNADPSGFGGGLNMYQFADGNPISETDPFGLGPDYGNPVSGRNGPVGPSNPYAAGLPYYPNGPFYVPGGGPPPTLVESLAGGIFIGAGIAAGVVLAAPAVVAGGAELTVGYAAAYGVTIAPATATLGASATVTAGLGATAIVGGVATGMNTYNNAVAGNWNAVAYNVGTLAGGAIVGVSGGGQALAEGISGQPTSAVSGLLGDSALSYNPNYPNGSILGWLGSGPTPQSGGAAATFTASGAGLFLQPSSSQGSQSSSTGK